MSFLIYYSYSIDEDEIAANTKASFTNHFHGECYCLTITTATADSVAACVWQSHKHSESRMNSKWTRGNQNVGYGMPTSGISKRMHLQAPTACLTFKFTVKCVCVCANGRESVSWWAWVENIYSNHKIKDCHFVKAIQRENPLALDG